MNKYSCFIMGMPAAGKTTFLAALWYCLTNSDKNRLKFKRSNKNLNYLSDICEEWSQLKTIPRTRQGLEELDLTLVLEDTKGKEIELTFPDLSGETFQAQYEKREMSGKVAEYIKDTSCIILFINPITINETSLISDVPAKFRPNKKDVGDISTEINKLVPLQVQLVELLQFVQYVRKQLAVKLELLVSAWDSIEGEESQLRPEEYIRKHLPLLWQYVKSNTEFFGTIFFGISAQGGYLNDEERPNGGHSDDRDKLVEIQDPCERVFIVDNDGRRSGDITLPLCEIGCESYEE